MQQIKNESLDELFRAIMTLKNLDECYMFFEDICTVKELIEISQRFQVAKLLDKKEKSEAKSYVEIRDLTGASTATITRINKCLNYGNDGYRLVLDRLKESKDSKNNKDS